MKVKMLAAIAVSSVLAVSLVHAAPATNDNMNDNIGSVQGPTQLADNGMSGASSMSGTSSMSGAGSNMSGTSSNNMSGTSSPMSGMTGMSGTSSSSPSDEGGADTATGDDY